MSDWRDDASSMSGATHRRLFSLLEPLVLLAVPLVAAACALYDVRATAFLTLALVVFCIVFISLGIEADQPRLRQLMPVVVLAAVAAAGRLLFAAFPDVKPVSAIVIVAGATLGRREGFAVGALCALVSNFYFGQGAWTPLQMYAWGLVGYLSGVLADHGLLRSLRSACVLGFLSAMLYGLVLNSWHVLGFVRPLTWQTTAAAFATGFPLDVVHGIATVAFLSVIWNPWTRQLRRVVAKYGLG